MIARPLAAALLAVVILPQGAQAFDNVPLSYGHYCGVGHSEVGRTPIDGLDAACMRHDRCADRTKGVPACSCHRAFTRSVRRIGQDPAYSPTIQALARNMVTAIGRVPCTDDRGRLRRDDGRT